MGKTTSIAWTDKTWNPWQGCHKVSAGCANCYMHREKKRYGQDPGTVVRSKPPTFNAPKKWADPALVFTCSWSDFFIAEADPWRDEAWEIIRATPHLTYQILTKRPERIARCLPAGWGDGWPNVWIGVSVEDQAAADERIPHLLAAVGAHKFLSVEPLLGPVNLETAFAVCDRDGESLGPRCNRDGSPAIGWCIVGGEGGPGARPCDVAWIRSLLAQCREAGTAAFVKQLGAHALTGYYDHAFRDLYEAGGFEWPDPEGWGERDGQPGPGSQVRLQSKGDPKNSDPANWPADIRVREMPEVKP